MEPIARSDHGNHSVGLNTRSDPDCWADWNQPPPPCEAAGSSMTPATNTALSIARHSMPKMIKTIPIAQKKARHMVDGRIMVCRSQTMERESQRRLCSLPCSFFPAHHGSLFPSSDPQKSLIFLLANPVFHPVFSGPRSLRDRKLRKIVIDGFFPTN